MNLDQYYTNPAIAKQCIDEIAQSYNMENHQCVEPSAGSGAFYNIMPSGSLAYDLEPKAYGIIESDFFNVKLVKSTIPIMTIGNPPFGKNASLAVKFFNHAATFSEVIAFIVPRTFRKPSIQNRLDGQFHIVHDSLLPSGSFIYEDEPYDVPCCFQIWERREEQRGRIVTRTLCDDFTFTTSDNADFAIQRVGANAGKIKTDLTLSPESHYFIKGQVIDIMRMIDFSEVKMNTAGNPSISKHEIITLYEALLHSRPVTFPCGNETTSPTRISEPPSK